MSVFLGSLKAAFKDVGKYAVSSMPLLKNPRTRLVLMHHDLSPTTAPQHSPLYSTTPERFREQIECLGRHFDFVDLEEMFGKSTQTSDRALASLTFDDGFLSVKEVALPYLAARRIPFTVFVSADAMRENRLTYNSRYSELNRTYSSKAYLDENDVRELDRAGVRIGSHSLSHKVLSDCDPATQDREITGNQEYLERLLGKPIQHFAIPYGKKHHYNDGAIDRLRRAGLHFIYSNNPTTFREGQIDPGTGLIPRIGLTSENEREVKFMINRAVFKTIDL